MKLQFSLATLLVSMTVLAVVCAASVLVPVIDSSQVGVDHRGRPIGVIEFDRSPTVYEFAWRLAFWGLASCAALWLISRVRRPNRPLADRIRAMKFRPHFTLRDLFWLTLVVALAMGWFLEHRKWVMVDPLLVDTELPRTQLYAIMHARAENIYTTLKKALVSKPEVSLTFDGRTNSVYVKAAPMQQAAIARLIEKMDINE